MSRSTIRLGTPLLLAKSIGEKAAAPLELRFELLLQRKMRRPDPENAVTGKFRDVSHRRDHEPNRFGDFVPRETTR